MGWGRALTFFSTRSVLLVRAILLTCDAPFRPTVHPFMAFGGRSAATLPTLSAEPVACGLVPPVTAGAVVVEAAVVVLFLVVVVVVVFLVVVVVCAVVVDFLVVVVVWAVVVDFLVVVVVAFLVVVVVLAVEERCLLQAARLARRLTERGWIKMSFVLTLLFLRPRAA